VTLAHPPVADEDLEPPPPPRRARLTPLGRLVALSLVLLLAASTCAAYVVDAARGRAVGEQVSVVIPPGASAAAIARRLERAGVIRSAWLFSLYARLRGRAGALKPGEYALRRGMSYAAALAALERGPRREFVRVTIPEGETLQETARILERAAGIPAAAFVAEATSGRYRSAILPPGVATLEGLLFPKTYDLEPGTTAAEAVTLLLRQFEKETASLDWSRAARLGVTPYEAVIVASLVEREARVAADRPKIARVIYNRLARGMRLQIDATVQYAIFLRTGAYKNPLLESDYRTPSPYNTYLIDGLPPTPIASPGLASLRAALEPAEGSWLYYVLVGEHGEHAFADTYDEFLRLKNARR
jgi:UPF0755 protein